MKFVIKYTLIPSMEMLTLSSALRGMGILLRGSFLGSGGGSLVDNVRVLDTLETGGVK